MLRLRQIAFASADLAAAEAELTTSLAVELCYRDPNVRVFGLRNALFPVGDQFLEIVSPLESGTTAGRLLAKRGFDCGYMVLFQVAELGSAERRVSDAGIRVVFEGVGEGIRGIHLHPRDVPGAIVSIDAGEVPSEWPWAGSTWRDHVNRAKVHAIVGMDVAVAEPTRACATWAHVLGASMHGDSFRTDDATVRFVEAVPAAGREGIIGVSFATSDAALVGTRQDVLGVSFRFVAG